MTKKRTQGLVSLVKSMTSGYVCKGGKDNRIQQRGRMLAFARYAEEKGAKHIDQVGASHVIGYWKHCLTENDFSNKTLIDHWYAIRKLWDLAGKPGRPPKPNLRSPPAPPSAVEGVVDNLSGCPLPPTSAPHQGNQEAAST